MLSPGSRTPALAAARTLTLRNRQRVCRVNLRLLRRIAQELLRQTCPERGFDLAICLVAAPEITRLNETFLRHKGTTDVITFDYSENMGQAFRLSSTPAPPPLNPQPSTLNSQPSTLNPQLPTLLHGEIFVCLDEAVAQARRFRATWQSELVRYVVHGVLHLLGYDDQHNQARRKMKTAEDGLVRQLARQFDFSRLGLRS